MVRQLARFIQADALIPSPGNFMAWDRYAYSNNNSLKYIDPNGHCPLLVTAAIGAVIGAGVGALTYSLTNQGDSYDGGELAVAAAGGAIAGALIGSGIGLVAGAGTTAAAAAASGTSTALISSGVSATFAAENYMIQSAGDFDTQSYVVNTGAAGVEGYITPGLSFPEKAVTEMALGGVAYLATTDTPSTEGFGSSVAAGLAGAVIDSGVSFVGDSLDDAILVPRQFANSSQPALQEIAKDQRIQNAILTFFGGTVSSTGTDITSYFVQVNVQETK